MDVTLSVQAKEFINSQVQQGLYPSIERVLEAGILALKEQSMVDKAAFEYSVQNRGKINALLEKGLADSLAGRVMSSSECFDRVRQNITAKYS